MGAALRRAAFSPNIKERRDYSCALFDPDGVAVSVGDHMPVHLGAMPMSVEAALEELGRLEPGRRGVPERSVPWGDPPAGHHADRPGVRPRGAGKGELLGYVGLAAPTTATWGARPPARCRSPARSTRRGSASRRSASTAAGCATRTLWRILLANVRTPGTSRRPGRPARGARHRGGRLLEIARRRGGRRRAAPWRPRRLRRPARRGGAPADPGRALRAEDSLEDDGFGSGPDPDRVDARGAGGDAPRGLHRHLAPGEGGVNAVAAITASAVRYVVRCVVEALLGGRSRPAAARCRP
jgi:N-methylhydantoinase B